MRIRNLVIYSKNQRELERLQYEYHHYCGYSVHLAPGKLTVFAKWRPMKQRIVEPGAA